MKEMIILIKIKINYLIIYYLLFIFYFLLFIIYEFLKIKNDND